MIFRRVSEQELSFLLDQLHMLISSGLTLDKALEILSTQYEEPIRSYLLGMRRDIQKGEPIYKAFSQAKIFPPFIPQMLKSAQRGENLEDLIKASGEFLRQVSELQAKVINTITYPLVVIGLSVIAVLVVLKLVIPKISQVLLAMGKELPLITKALILLSSTIGYLVYLIPVLVVLYITRDRTIGRERWDRFFLKIPILGEVSYFFNLSRFALLLQINLKSGVPIEQALLLSSDTFSNLHLKNALRKKIQDVVKGAPIYRAFKDSGIFPEFFINMVRTGERSGELERALETVSEFYYTKAIRTIERWTRLAEPIAMLLVAMLVGFLALSVLLPLTQI